MSSKPRHDTPQAPELLDEAVAEQAHDDEEVLQPAGRFGYLCNSVGLRVAALSGLAIITIGLGVGTDGWGSSTCC